MPKDKDIVTIRGRGPTLLFRIDDHGRLFFIRKKIGVVVLIRGWSFILFYEKNPGGRLLKGGHLFFPTISLTGHV